MLNRTGRLNPQRKGEASWQSRRSSQDRGCQAPAHLAWSEVAFWAALVILMGSMWSIIP